MKEIQFSCGIPLKWENGVLIKSIIAASTEKDAERCLKLTILEAIAITAFGPFNSLQW